MIKNFFKLFSHCIPVKGHFRSTICDLQRNDYELIPNDLYNILTSFKNKSIHSILKNFGEEDHSTIYKYFDFLIEKELGFWTDKPMLFPDISLEYRESAKITNAIIDHNRNSRHDYESIFNQLDSLQCRSIQLRFFDPHQIELLVNELNLLKKTGILSIEILLKYDSSLQVEEYERFVSMFPRLERVIIHSSPFDKYYNDFDKYRQLYALSFIQKAIQSEAHCGIIHSGYFVKNLDNYIESQEHNSCLNKKISIDSLGFIKNCPSQNHHYGHTSTTTLAESLKNREFKKLWKISKDTILNCRDCEFRFICTDCRVFIEDENNIYSKPIKCGYNPYIGKWKEEQGFVPISDIGTFENNTFNINSEKLDKINKKNWGG